MTDKIKATLQYEYVNTGGEMNIKTPDSMANFSEVESFVIDDGKKSGVIKSLTYYPNGFCYYSEVEPTKITFRTSHQLSQIDDGSFEIQFDD